MRDPEQEYFVDGMTEALITELAQIRSLQVRGRTTVMRFKDTDKSLPEIARELDVDGIIEGSVMREGDEVRITAQLIHGPSDTHRWAGSFDSAVTSIFKLHSEMALAIANEVQANLTPGEETRLADAEDIDPQVYDLLLRGDMAGSRQSLAGNRQAKAFYERALTLDPTNVEALANLGVVDWLSSIYGWSEPEEAIPAGKARLQQALDINPDDPVVNSWLGWIAMGYDYDWTAADTRFRRAAELAPNNAGILHGLAWAHFMSRRYDEGRRTAERALELDPFDPTILDLIADAYSKGGRYDAAIEQRRATLDLAPNHAGTLHNLMDDYLCAGMYDEALQTFERLVAAHGPQSGAHHAVVLAYSGQEDEARELLKSEIVRAETEFVSAFRLSLGYIALGETDAALDWLEQAYEQRVFRMVHIVDWLAPLFAPIQDAPRYQAILDKMNFPEHEDAN